MEMKDKTSRSSEALSEYIDKHQQWVSLAGKCLSAEVITTSQTKPVQDHSVRIGAKSDEASAGFSQMSHGVKGYVCIWLSIN